MKKLLLIFIVLLLVSTTNYDVYGDEEHSDTVKITDELIMNQLESIDITEIEDMIYSFNQDENINIPNINIKQMILSMIKGEGDLSIRGILDGLIDILLKEILMNSKLLAELVFIALLCALLKNLSNSFEDSTIGDIAFYACYLVVIGIAIKGFILSINIGQQAIDNMVIFMQALIPVLLSLLIAVGSITTSAIFKPIIVAAIGITSTIIKDFIIPLIFFTTILSIVNNLTTKIQVTKLVSLLKQACMAFMGIILTIFLGVISIQGVLASSTDGVTLRTAKFAMDKFIPIVGGFMSEAIDAVLGCSLLLKNAIGVVGLILILIIVSFPIIKILSLIIIYKIVAALIEPFSDSKIVNCLNDMSGSLVMVFATVISVAIMFFIAITAVVGAGNITAMIR